MKKFLVSLVTVVVFAGSAFADPGISTLKILKKGNKYIVSVRGTETLTEEVKLPQAASELIDAFDKGGVKKLQGIEGAIWNGKALAGSVSFAGNIFFEANFTLSAKERAKAVVNFDESVGEALDVTFSGAAATELMEVLRKAGYKSASLNQFGASSTDGQFVSCSAPVVAKPVATCRISTTPIIYAL